MPDLTGRKVRHALAPQAEYHRQTHLRETDIMLTLHEYAHSQNCWKVRVLLRLHGTPYRSHPVAIFSGESRTPKLALNPVGSTPALVLEDGRVIAESNAMLCYLAEGT